MKYGELKLKNMLYLEKTLENILDEWEGCDDSADEGTEGSFSSLSPVNPSIQARGYDNRFNICEQ